MKKIILLIAAACMACTAAFAQTVKPFKEELTNQEIAERMNLSVNTVKTHYTEALKMLRIHLSKMLIIVTFVTLMTYLSVHYLR